ncbi:MAG: hypothetical protein ABI041_16985 [Bdellovibrionia bacterium]
MTLSIVAALLLFSQSVFASSFSIEMADSHKIYLSGQDCESVKKEVELIQQWTIGRHEIATDLQIHCEDNPSLNSIDITSILPKIVREQYGVYPSCDGPNCWNWSLVESKLESTLRYVDNEEWKFYLEKYCRLRQVKNNDPVQAGDVAAIRHRNKTGQISEVHGFISVGELACTKNGYTNENPYRIQPVEEVFDTYDVSPFSECRIGLENPPPYCKTYVNFFQCSKERGKSMEDLGDYQILMTALADLNVIDEITSLMEASNYSDLTSVKDKLITLGKISLNSPEIIQLRDVLIQSLNEQVSFFDDRNKIAEFDTESDWFSY